NHEVARAVLVVALRQEIVVVSEGVPHIGDEREPGGALRRARLQAAAVERMVDHGAELVRRNARHEAPQRGLDLGAFGQCSLAAGVTAGRSLARMPTIRQGARSEWRTDAAGTQVSTTSARTRVPGTAGCAPPRGDRPSRTRRRPRARAGSPPR